MVLIEVDGILNSKPLGYATSDMADPDPIMPNLLLMGQQGASLPQAIDHNSVLMSPLETARCWQITSGLSSPRTNSPTLNIVGSGIVLLWPLL